MRRLCSLRTRVRALAPVLALSAIGLHPDPAPAQDDENPPFPPLPPFENVALRVENITSPGQELQKLVVTYASTVRIDVDSIDGEDIWVASRNGYNQVGRLVEVHELPLPPVPAEGAPLLDGQAGGGILPHLYFMVEATYAFAPGAGDSWSAEDNGVYAILLQRGQVLRRDGSAFAPDLLGYFGVGIGLDPEPAFPVKTEIFVQQVPQIAVVPLPPAEFGAHVRLTFEAGGVEIESWGEVVLEGDTYTAEVIAVGDADPLPGGAGDVVGAAVRSFIHSYALGIPAPGDYKFVLTSRGRVLGSEKFRVPETPDEGPPPARVGLTAEWINSFSATIRSYVEFHKPGWELTDPGELERVDDFTHIIEATAERTPDTPTRFGRRTAKRYHLSPLKAGLHTVIYRINGYDFNEVSFEIVGGSEEPHIQHVEIHEGDAGHSAEVFVLLPNPEIGILSWGHARREGNRFFAELVVGPIPEPGPVGPDAPRPDGVPEDSPLRIVNNFYNLGVLEPGAYAFHITHVGEPVFTEEFKVRPAGDDAPPSVKVDVDPIEEPKTRPHDFDIEIEDPDGVDNEAFKEAKVWVINRRLRFRAEARLVEFFPSDPTVRFEAIAVYEIDAPGVAWDALDRGKYEIHIEPEKVRDLNGNHIEDSKVGRFKVDIWPDPPGFPRAAEIEIGHDEEAGVWNAKVAIELPEALAAPDDWEIDWGEVRHHGHVLVAHARYHKVGERPVDDAAGLVPRGAGSETQKVRHEYELGALRGGRYLFVFLSNLGHFGKERFNVGTTGGGDFPGEIEPFEAWQAGAFAPGDWAVLPKLVAAGSDPDADRWSNFEEYAFGLDPRRPDASEPPVRAEIVEDDAGGKHLGIRYDEMLAADDVMYRILGSKDLVDWADISAEVDLVHREADVEGRVEVLACVRELLGASPWRYLKVQASPVAEE